MLPRPVRGGCRLHLTIQSLDKGGEFRPGRLLSGYFALLASPFVGVAAASVWWRRHRWLPAVVLAVASTCLGLTLWGNLTDYREWSRIPPGNEVMHLGAFLMMLWCWTLCLGLAVIGAIAWRVGGDSVPRALVSCVRSKGEVATDHQG